jgi:dolichol-phosphate mannosyltransferase
MATISIVTPVYFNELNLPDTIPELLALREALQPDDLELVFVDDGSGDRSLEILLDFRARHPDVIRVVKLTRNFGSMSAIQAGMRVASGDCVAMVAADLQDPPELLVQMADHWRRGQKAVFAVRIDRDEPWSQKLFSNTFYALVRRFAIRAYPPGGFDLFLIDRQVLDEVNRIAEKNVNVLALIFWLGYANVQIPYVRRARRKGKSRWTLSKKVKLVVDSFVSFSYAPIRALSIVGFVVATAAFAYALFVAYQRLVNNIPVQGFATTVILIALTSGIQMAMLGVLGEYLWRALDESRKRPAYVIDEVYADPAA